MTPTLYQFFHRHVQHGFGRVGITEPATVAYVSDLLTRFARTEALYPFNDQEQRPLTTLVQFLREQRVADKDDRGHAIVVVRHLAEYTLFMSGFFRERLRARGQLSYYADHGRSAYGQTADFEKNGKRAQVYRRLKYDFARVAEALDDIRHHQFPLTNDGPGERTLAALWRR